MRNIFAEQVEEIHLDAIEKATAEVIRLAKMVDDFAELQYAIKRLEELLK